MLSRKNAALADNGIRIRLPVHRDALSNDGSCIRLLVPSGGISNDSSLIRQLLPVEEQMRLFASCRVVVVPMRELVGTILAQ